MDFVVPAFLAAFFGGAKGRLDAEESAIWASLLRLPADLRESAEKGLGALEALESSPSLAGCSVVFEPAWVSEVGENPIVASVAATPPVVGLSRGLLRAGKVEVVDEAPKS